MGLQMLVRLQPTLITLFPPGTARRPPRRTQKEHLMYSLCQRCGEAREDSWNIKQAEFHVGRLEHWKVQLCRPCLDVVEQAVLAALRPQPGAVPRAD